MAGFETFTIMAILDASDKASEVLERAQAVIDKFKESMGSAAETATAAGEEIDASLLQTASGTDALGLANDRLSASQAKVAVATQQQAEAERELQAVYTKGLGLNDQILAGDKLSAAIRDVAKASGEAQAAQQSLNDVQKVLQGTTDELTTSEEAAAAASTGWVGIAALAGAAIAGAGGLAVKAAADYQTSVTHLVTDAGESTQKIGEVSQGMLDMAGQVGISADKLSQGMYHIESSGFHATKALDMLRVAAEGAAVGNADVDTVSKTLSGTMVSYGDSIKSPVSLMNMLIETTAQGDLRMQDLASTLGNVTPIAAAAKISFDQVGGAIATMTSQNMSAAQSTQNLAHFIESLAKPTDVTRQAMQGLGIDATDVSMHLGDRGLTGTLDVLTKAIDEHNHYGGVFINTLQGSQAAAQQANNMLGVMAPTVRGLSQELLDGKIGVKDYTKAIEDLDPASVKQGHQFLSLQEKMGAFNKLVSSGTPEAESYNAALSSVTGGQIGLRTALMLSVDGGQKFSSAQESIANTGKDAGNSVKNWDTIQQTFNQHLNEAKASLESLGITLGQKIMPAVEDVLSVMAKALDWFSKNKNMVNALATSLGTFLVAALVIVGTVVGVVIATLTILGFVIEGIAKAAEWVGGEIKKAWDWIVRETEKLWKDVVKHAESIWKDLKKTWDKISDDVSSVWNSISDFFKKWWPLLYAIFATPIFMLQAAWHKFHADIMSVVTPTWNWISNTVSGAWDWLVGKAESAWGWIYHNIVTPISEAIDWVDRHIDEIGNSISDAFNSTLKWLEGVYKSFNSVGENILIGIWNGIVNKWDWLMNKVSDLANGLLQTAKDAIGVKSPSRRFADEFGKWIPHGIAAGVEEHGDVARNAVNALSDSLHFTGGPDLGGAGGFGTGGSAVYIDLRGSQVMSDRDMDLFVDKIGRQIATRLLPSGGVRIRA